MSHAPKLRGATGRTSSIASCGAAPVLLETQLPAAAVQSFLRSQGVALPVDVDAQAWPASVTLLVRGADEAVVAGPAAAGLTATGPAAAGLAATGPAAAGPAPAATGPVGAAEADLFDPATGAVLPDKLAERIRAFVLERLALPKLDKNIDGRASRLPQWLAQHGYGEFFRKKLAERNAHREKIGCEKPMTVVAFELLEVGTKSGKVFCEWYDIDLEEGCSKPRWFVRAQRRARRAAEREAEEALLCAARIVSIERKEGGSGDRPKPLQGRPPGL